MPRILSVDHAELVGVNIEVFAEHENFSPDEETAELFDDGYLECIISINGSPTWGIFIVRKAQAHCPSFSLPTYGVILLSPVHELMSVGIEYDTETSHFYAQVEDIFTGKKFRLFKQLTGPEPDSAQE